MNEEVIVNILLEIAKEMQVVVENQAVILNQLNSILEEVPKEQKVPESIPENPQAMSNMQSFEVANMYQQYRMNEKPTSTPSRVKSIGQKKNSPQ